MSSHSPYITEEQGFIVWHAQCDVSKMSDNGPFGRLRIKGMVVTLDNSQKSLSSLA